MRPTHAGMRPRHGWGTRLYGRWSRGFGCGAWGAAADLVENLLDRQQPPQVNELQQPQLEVKALLLPVAQFVEGAQHDLQEAAKFLFAELLQRTIVLKLEKRVR